MLRSSALSFAAIAAVSALPAQSLFTSPANLQFGEGQGNHAYILFSQYGMRWQQIDHTHRGSVYPNINAILLRRDAETASNANWAARNLTNVSIVMAHVDPVTFAPSGSNLNGTYKDVPVTTVTVPQLSLPDWTNTSGMSPEPFTVAIPFTTGWSYNGVDDFVWELTYDTNDNTADYGNDYAADTMGTTTSTSGSIVPGSVGCIPSTDTSGFDITGSFNNHGTHFRLTFGATDCTANQTAFLYLGFTDPNLSLPGVCGPIHTDASLLAAFPIGTASSIGNVATSTYDNIPYTGVVEGLTFYGQLLALDLGATSAIPIVVSNGRRWTMPAAPTTGHNCTRLYNYLISSTSTSWVTSGPWYGGIVAAFGY